MFVLLGGINLTHAPSGSAVSELFETFEIPIFEGGYNIEKKMNPSIGTKAIIYNVQIKYPAAEIIEFYDSYLNGRGWISSFEICQRHWADSADDTEYGDLPARNMFVSWQHPGLNLKLELWLKHGLADRQQDEVTVEGLLQPIVD